MILLCNCTFLYAQQFSITGVVTDKKLKEPIIGASVIVKGTTNGTVTDLDGKFTIQASKSSVLIVSFIGYTPQEFTINGNQTFYQISLAEDTQTLDEVVVVGFGTQKKVNLTGAVATVDKKTLESRPVTSVSQALQGVMPGLNIDMNDKGGRLDYNPTMNIRGTGNLNTGSSASPLDAAASAIYGSRAPFGVILVTTKSGEAGKATIQYSNNFRWSRPTNIPDMLDSYRFAKYFNAAQKNSGSGTTFIFTDDTIDRIQKYMAGEYPYTSDPNGSQGNNFFPFNVASNDNQNWPRNFIDKTSFGQEHNLSISGGG